MHVNLRPSQPEEVLTVIFQETLVTCLVKFSAVTGPDGTGWV